MLSSATTIQKINNKTHKIFQELPAYLPYPSLESHTDLQDLILTKLEQSLHPVPENESLETFLPN